MNPRAATLYALGLFVPASELTAVLRSALDALPGAPAWPAAKQPRELPPAQILLNPRAPSLPLDKLGIAVLIALSMPSAMLIGERDTLCNAAKMIDPEAREVAAVPYVPGHLLFLSGRGELRLVALLRAKPRRQVADLGALPWLPSLLPLDDRFVLRVSGESPREKPDIARAEMTVWRRGGRVEVEFVYDLRPGQRDRFVASLTKIRWKPPYHEVKATVRSDGDRVSWRFAIGESLLQTGPDLELAP
jgi:hypothetical protein